ncbi:hypothetical protein Airi01_074500 [Actinoallomurus iriomotensis]|uniref:Uncharacterized protein n=1 Tax=Actinoallomurus iriomotensis TaxID=478107 RepID=A0A9W6RP22_9ACTN|nr:hypothetical protein Airi01_074500 [Actinoallomurus iriomotensis]
MSLVLSTSPGRLIEHTAVLSEQHSGKAGKCVGEAMQAGAVIKGDGGGYRPRCTRGLRAVGAKARVWHHLLAA